MPKITLRTIAERLNRVLNSKGKEPIEMKDPVTKWLVGGGNIRAAFVGKLNDRGPYRADGVIFTPNAFNKAKVMYDIVTVIANTYRARNFKVII